MRLVVDSCLGGIVAAALAGAACAQPVAPPSPPASASVPAAVASRAAPARNPAITAAENAKEPGVQRPEERVIPQISVPLKSRQGSATVSASASAPAAGRPAAVNDGAARCLASSGSDKAACERGSAASAPVKR
jgi:hypothetical protein